MDTSQFQIEIANIRDLKPHPRNYREHPDDQLDHIVQSIQQHGLYRNIVVSSDGYTLAGHGVVKALTKMGHNECPIVRVNADHDSPDALKLLVGDNEIEHLGEVNDRLLSELLKEVKDNDLNGLLGTGYDEMMLANLMFVSRPGSEIKDFNEASQWVGMPEFGEASGDPLKLSITFRNEADRKEFAKQAEALGLQFGKKESRTWSTWWPFREGDDLQSLRFENTA